MKNLAKIVAIAALSIFSLGGAGHAPKGKTTYYNHDRCGTARHELEHHVMTPVTYARGNVDRVRGQEHFYANWHQVDRYEYSDSGFILKETLYSDGSAERSTCVDLRLTDLDDDGDLDMVYLTTREIVVLKNKGYRSGKFEMESDISMNLDDKKPPRLKFPRVNGTRTVQIVEDTE